MHLIAFEKRMLITLSVSATSRHSTERGLYDRLCQGSREINRICTQSYTLASVSSSGRSATPMLLLQIMSSALMAEQVRHVH
jgi:hypothetical protein